MVAGLADGPVAPDWLLFHDQLSNTLQYWLERAENLAHDWTEFDAESLNIARVVEYGLQIPETCSLALRLVTATRQSVLRRGSALFGDDLLARMSAAARRAQQGPDNGTDTATALEIAGQLYQRRGRLPDAERCYRESLAIAAFAQQPDLLEYLQAELGRFLVECERGPEGLPFLRQALALAEQHGNRLVAARALLVLGWYYHHIWDGATSEMYLARALPLVETLGEPNHLCRLWLDLANAHWRLGNHDRARSDCERARQYAAQSGDIRMQALITGMVGVLQCDSDQFDAAVESLLAAEQIYRRLDHRYDLAGVHMSLSAAYWGLRQWGPARRYAQTAVTSWRMLGQELSEVEALLNLAEIQLDSGEFGAAVSLLAAASDGIQRQAARPELDLWRRRMAERLESLELRTCPAAA